MTLQDQQIYSPRKLAYIYLYVSSENLILYRGNIPKLMILFVLITFLHQNALILLEEIRHQSINQENLSKASCSSTCASSSSTIALWSVSATRISEMEKEEVFMNDRKNMPKSYATRSYFTSTAQVANRTNSN